MTTDSNQYPSDLPELPESIKHLGEGPLGDGFRRLFAELVKEFSVEQIAQIVSGSEVTPREIAELKAELEAEGWKVLTSSTPRPNPLNLDIRELKVHIPRLESFLFPERPAELSGFEKLQVAARPIRYSDIPDELIFLRPDAKTIDQRLKDLLGLRLSRGAQAGSKSSEDAVGSDQLAAFEHLRSDEAAAASLRKSPKNEPYTPTAAEFRAEYAALLSRLEFLEGRRGGTTGQSTQKWLAEYDRMVAAQAAAAPETAQQTDDAVSVPSDLWYALRSVLDMPRLREALVSIAEQEYYYPDWYAEELDIALEKLATFDAEQQKKVKDEQEKAEAEGGSIPAHPGDLKLSEAVKKLLKRTEGLLLVDPLKHSKSDAELQSEGNRVHDLVEKSYREKGFSATVVDILFGKLGSEDSLKAETEPEKPETPEAPEPTSSFGSKFGEPISGVFVDYLELIGSKEDSKPDEPSTGRDLSADFSLQDLIADYDETKLRSVSQYINRYGNRFPVLFSDLAQVLNAEGFSDRDRLVMVLGALDGYEASEYYRVGEAYRISQIRQLLKRQR